MPAADDELVPLSAAATVAHFHLTGRRLPDTPQEGREEVVGLTTIALAQVAAVRTRDARGEHVMTQREVRELLVQPLQLEQPVDLERFLIRRGELRTAIRALAELWQSLSRP